MARIRFVKPEFFSDAKLVRMKPITRLFYIGLFVQADRAGCFHWNEDDLQIKIIPYDRASASDCLAELLRAGRIIRYGDQKQYGMIVNFLKHQYINPREPESKIPQPNKDIIQVLYQSDTGILDARIRNKDKGERETGKPENSVTYLKTIPVEDLFEFYKRFDCTKQALISKGEDLWNYCKAHGRKYSDYKIMMLNALKKDFPERRKDDKLRNSKLMEVDGVMKIIPPEMQADIKKLTSDKTYGK